MNHLICVKEFYKENKRYVLFSVFALILFSILAYGNVGQIKADEIAGGAALANGLGGSFGLAIIPLVENGFLAGIDTASLMILVSIAALTTDLAEAFGFSNLGFLSNYSFGFFDNHFISIICLIWFGLPKLLKCFSKTNALGLAIESQFAKLNGAINIILAASQTIANVPSGVSVEAASLTSNIKKFHLSGFDALKCIFILLLTLVVYFFIRFMSFFVDIILLPVMTVFPFVSTIYEGLKFVIIAALIGLAFLNPTLFAAIFAGVFILSVLFFRRAYITVRYFKNVYMKPIFKKLFDGYRQDIPLDFSNEEKKIRRQLPKQVEEFAKEHSADILIPIYLVKNMPGSLPGLTAFKYDRYWLISSEEGQFICKTGFIKKNIEIMKFSPIKNTKVFLKMSKLTPFVDIFTLAMPEEEIVKPLKHIAKHVHFVFSREYFYRYDEIKAKTGYIDFNEYKEFLKESMAEKDGNSNKKSGIFAKMMG